MPFARPSPLKRWNLISEQVVLVSNTEILCERP
jgi:hypothetical protein